TLTYTGPATSTYGLCTVVNLSAVLMDTITGHGVSGATINFTLGTQTATGITDSNGTANAAISLNQNAGSPYVSAAYAGSLTLASAGSGNTSFTISSSSNVGPVPGASLYTGTSLVWT